MKNIFVAIFFAATFSLSAAALPRGNDRLRELVVFPEMNLSFNFCEFSRQNNDWVVTGATLLPEEISRLRRELKLRPDNIENQLELANLLDQNGETNESMAGYQAAERLCRNKIAIQPENGPAMTELGVALDGLNRTDEAEHAFRQATLVSANEWQCWVGLGNFLESERFPGNLSPGAFFGQGPSQAILNARPPPAAFITAADAFKEASQCFDRAMVLAPGEPEVFIQRAGFMGTTNFLDCLFRYYGGREKINSNEWSLAFYSPGAITNLQTASRLRSKDPQLVSLAVFFEWSRERLQSKISGSDPNLMPEATRRSIRAAMTHLEDLSQEPDTKLAAGALANLGFLNAMFGNVPEGIINIRRAVALDPTDDRLWDAWFGLSLASAAPSDLVAIGRAHVKARDSARNRIILSKILAAKMGEWNEAVEQAEIAAKLDPSDIFAPLMLAAITLKRDDQPTDLALAKTSLERANELLQKGPHNQEALKRWRELTLDSVIFMAWTGQPQRAMSFASLVLKYFPDDPTAKSLLQVIGG
jgi:tetratricopeptide (TPR) repeat protein